MSQPNQLLSSPELEYADKVFKLLISDMRHGQEFDIIKHVQEHNRETFIETVKLFIQSDYGRHLGNFYIEFNNTYTKLRKLNYF